MVVSRRASCGIKTERLPQVFEEQETDFALSCRVRIRSLSVLNLRLILMSVLYK
jgi:hypothetical protein